MKKTVSMLLAVLTVMTMLFCLGVVTPAASAAETYTVTVDTSKYFTIKNVGAGKYLNVYKNSSANNANVTLWAADGTSGEDFKFAKSGSHYIMVPRCATSRAVNVYTASNAKAGNNVCTWTKTGHDTQAWVAEYVETSKAFIFRSANNKNLVLTAASNKNGANVSVTTYSAGNKYQLWTSSALKAAQAKSQGKTDNNSTAKYSLCWPVSSSASGYKKITSSLGNRTAPIAGATASHKGIDIGCASNSKIMAAADGVVLFAGSTTNGRGNCVAIYHSGQGLTTVYQHLNSYSVAAGQTVTKGQAIGKSGMTGVATGPHLHFEIVVTAKSPASKQECAWASGAKLIDGHYDNKLISYEYRK